MTDQLSARLVPLLIYQDIPAAHDFLVHAFGFTSGGVERSPEGLAMHAEVRAFGSPIWLHRTHDELKLGSPAALPASASGLVVFVPDVDAHYREARARGARIESEPRDMPYGQREYGARDPEGHRWWFATKAIQPRHFLLLYDVVPDYAERRGQFREAHLAKTQAAAARGELILGGALADPVDGAVLLFAGASPAVAEDFARTDPYVLNGLVTRWRVRPWTTVAGSAAATPAVPRAAPPGA